MKGFLIKDFRILLQRRMFVFALILMGIMFSISNQDVFYTSMLAMVLAFSTLSYDAYDNGMAYLMTMPNARKNYAKEKYLFFGIVLAVNLIIAYLINVIVSLARYDEIRSEYILTESIVILPIFLFTCSVCIPVMLRYGAEKGRLVIAFGGGCIAAVGVVLRIIAPGIVDIVASEVRDIFSGFSDKIIIRGILGCSIAVTAVMFVISIIISNKIMEKKEF